MDRETRPGLSIFQKLVGLLTIVIVLWTQMQSAIAFADRETAGEAVGGLPSTYIKEPALPVEKP